MAARRSPRQDELCRQIAPIRNLAPQCDSYLVTNVTAISRRKSPTLVSFAQMNMAMIGTYLAWMLFAQQGRSLLGRDLGGYGPDRRWWRHYRAQLDLAFGFGRRALGRVGHLRHRRDPVMTVGTVGALVVMVAVLYLVVSSTRIGLAFRAVSSNPESLRLVGIRTSRTLQFGWALAAALGTLGGTLVAKQTNLEPAFMAKLTIFTFAAATLGVLDSLGGAVIGAFIVA